MNAEQIKMLELCTLRMSYEWDKLYQFNGLLKRHPYIASVLCVSIKLADPQTDYYYPEIFSGYAIKVHISIGRKGAAKLNVIPFYPTRAVQDDPRLKDSTDLRFFMSGYTVVPFMGPIAKYQQHPMRYSKRFKTTIFENEHYLRWGFDHLSRGNTTTTVQLGTGFTVDSEPYVDPKTGNEATRFINDDKVCAVYHKYYDPETHECIDTTWQTITQYLGTSYIWELVNYGVDFKDIKTPRLDYRLDKNVEKTLIEKFTKELFSVREGLKEFPLLVDARREWGLSTPDSVWYLDADEETAVNARLYVGDECQFNNVHEYTSPPIPPNLQTDKYGFPISDPIWVDLLTKYTHLQEHLDDKESIDYVTFTTELMKLFGADLLLESGIVMTRGVFLSQVKHMTAILKSALPHMNAVLISKFGTNLAIKSMTIDIISIMARNTLIAVKTILSTANIFILFVNIIDISLHFADPIHIYERLTQSVLDQVAARSHDSLIGAFGERNTRVDISHISSCFDVPSAISQIKITLFIYALRPIGKFALKENIAYILGIPCLMQLGFILWEKLATLF